MASTLTASIDSWVDQDATAANHGQAAYLWLNGDGSHTKKAYIFFGKPFPPLAYISTATLYLYVGQAWSGSKTITIKRVTTSWTENTITYGTVPTVTSTHSASASVSSPTAGQQITFDLASMLTDVAAGGDWYGIEVTVSGTSTVKLYASENPDQTKRPALDVDWSKLPEDPVTLTPANGQAVSLARPTLGWQFDTKDHSAVRRQASSQVQISTSSSFASPEYDSGQQANTQANWDLSAVDYSFSLGTFTVTIASPAVFTLSSHGLIVGDRVTFTTTGALPTGLATGTDYFVSAVPSSSTFRVAATKGGADINTSGSQSGTHTLYRYGVASGATRYWRVRTWDDKGQVSAYSDAVSFTRQPKGTLTMSNPPFGLSATDFNGSTQYMSTSYNPFTNGTTRTYEGWAYRDTSTSDDVLIGGSVNAGPAIVLISGANTLRFYADRTGSAFEFASAWPGNTQWVHWMLIFNESTDALALWINGVLVGSTTIAATYNATPGNLQIGARFGATDPFDGKQAHVAVYGADMSAYAQSHYNTMLNGAASDYKNTIAADGGSNLLAYWPLNANNLGLDISGNSHNGTAQGGVTFGGYMDSTVGETTPPVTFALSGQTQESYELRLYRYDGTPPTKTQIWRLPRLVSSAASYSVPNGLLHETDTFRVELYEWDTIDRAVTPGDPDYVLLSRDFQYVRAGGPTAVTGLTTTAVDGGIQLDFARTSAPAYFAVKEDGKLAAGLDRLDPNSLTQGGTSYRYTYWNSTPQTAHTLEVEAVDLSSGIFKHSSGNSTASHTPTITGITLVDKDDNTRIVVVGPDSMTPDISIGEEGTTYAPIGSRRKVRIVDSVGGYEGTVSGMIQGNSARNNFLTLKGRSPKPFRLIFGGLNIEVILEEVSITRRGDVPTAIYDVSFTFFQNNAQDTFTVSGIG